MVLTSAYLAFGIAVSLVKFVSMFLHSTPPSPPPQMSPMTPSMTPPSTPPSTPPFLQYGALERKNGEELSAYIKRIQGIYCPHHPMCTSRDGDEYRRFGLMPEHCEDQYCSNDGCKCDEKCHLYDDCCPDANNFQNKIPRSACTPLSLKSNARLLKVEFTSTISRCPMDYEDEEISQKCELSTVKNNYELDERMLVTFSNITYGNKYCAICNGISKFEFWNFRVTCNRLMKLPSFKTEAEIYGMLANNSECDFQLVPPRRISLRSCTPDGSSSCPPGSNSNFQEACMKYKQTFFRNYKNLFCYLCNHHIHQLHCFALHETTPAPVPPFLSFSAILQFREFDHRPTDEKQTLIECKRGYEYDPKQEKCQEIHCPLGKWLRENQCDTIIQLPGTTYEYEVIVVYTVGDRIFDDDLYNGPTVDMIFFDFIRSFPDLLFMSSYEKTLISPSTEECVICLNESKVNGVNSIMFKMWLVLHRSEKDIDDIESLLNKLFVDHEVDKSPFGEINITLNYALTYMYLFNHRAIHRNYETHFLRRVDMGEEKHELGKIQRMKFNPFNRCPSIALNKSDLSFDANKFRLNIFSLNSTLSMEHVVVYGRNQFGVCNGIYLNISAMVDASAKGGKGKFTVNPPSSYIEGILSAVCTSLSILCLFITFVVYCIEKSLRTIPGINTMVLALTLAIAQALFTFGSTRTEIPLLCKVIGALIHYFWLTTIFLMNVCCIHMFRVFGSLLGGTNPNLASRKNLVYYFIYAFCTPMIFLGMNIGISLNNWDDIGYGRYVCYISFPKMIGYTFALPVGLVLISNIASFIIVIISISRTATKSSFAKSDRQYTLVYLRLSTITGITWVFGFIYYWTEVIVFSYIFIIMNCLQGLFLLMAFTCNRRVYKNLHTSSQSSNTGFTGVQSITSQRL